MRYCPDCGTGHECEGAVAPGASDAVRIAEIERDKEIALAKIQRSTAREELAVVGEIAEIEADTQVAVSAAEAEVVAAAIESGGPPEPEPIVVDAPTVIADEDPAEDAPPPAEGSAPPEPKRKASGLGMW